MLFISCCYRFKKQQKEKYLFASSDYSVFGGPREEFWNWQQDSCAWRMMCIADCWLAVGQRSPALVGSTEIWFVAVINSCKRRWNMTCTLWLWKEVISNWSNQNVPPITQPFVNVYSRWNRWQLGHPSSFFDGLQSPRYDRSVPVGIYLDFIAANHQLASILFLMTCYFMYTF